MIGGDKKLKEETYARIRASSKDAVIREEMIRLGFWKPADGSPDQMSDDWLEKRIELNQEIRKLANKQRRYENRQAMLLDMRKARMKAAREKREETKKKREEERRRKAAAWNEKKTNDIVYLGDGVSAGLNVDEDFDTTTLQKFGLPIASTIKELAGLLDTTINELRFLAFNREVSKTTHYKRFYLNKKSGGQRMISAPMPRLKAMQYKVLEEILFKVAIHEAVHGFAPGRSIITNAQPHIGRDVVINLDMKDFFPSVSYKRVKGLFRTLGYPEKVATVLGLMCTEPETEEVELDGERYFVHTSERRLPQGAPTSPALTNILCFKLDKRLTGMANSLGFTYTRYADDITFSASGDDLNNIKKLLWRTKSIVSDEGFTIHPDKTRIMRKTTRQEVTGLVVNEGLSVPRDELKKFRALLFQIEKDGPAGKTFRGSETELLSAIRGYSHFIKMVHPEKGAKIVSQVNSILKAHGWSHTIRHARKIVETVSESIATTPRSSKAQKGSILDKLKFWKK